MDIDVNLVANGIIKFSRGKENTPFIQKKKAINVCSSLKKQMYN